jgi:[CysO sulfur-carrier protein]-S-L-cysteine hydrolase
LSTPFRLLVPPELLARIIAQAQAERPNECCGLLAGVVEGGVGRVTARYPLVNALGSPTRYESEPRGMLDAFRDMRRLGLDVLAVYHSHPTSPPVPSHLDRELNWGPAVVNLIVSLATEPPTVRGWWLTEKDYRKAEWATE